MIDDPRLTLLDRALERRRPPIELPRLSGVREAAVALVLRPETELELLLIKRAEIEGDPWSGHMALPGGRRDAVDDDLLATAMRETREETGVPLERAGRVLGGLDEVGTRNPQLPKLIITPYIAAVPPGTDADPDPREVDAAFWVPLPVLRDESAISQLVVEVDGGRRAFEALQYGEHVIWGLTHRILTEFLGLIDSAGL